MWILLIGEVETSSDYIKILVSSDDTTYTQILSMNNTSVTKYVKFGSGARYIKVVARSEAVAGDYFRIYTIEVFEKTHEGNVDFIYEGDETEEEWIILNDGSQISVRVTRLELL